jgi:hypothetical protein
MKRSLAVVALCAFAAIAHAKGVPFAVESLEKAQQIVKQNSAKHVLVFFTSES